MYQINVNTVVVLVYLVFWQPAFVYIVRVHCLSRNETL